MRIIQSFIFILVAVFYLNAQDLRFEVELEPIDIENLGGLQSYAIGTHNGDWLIIGGRLDGLHRRQPWATFDPDGNNQEIIVVNPETKQVWKKNIATLSPSLKEQLASTNMQFYQKDHRLILTGGYAYSPTHDDHITFPYLTVVDVPEVIEDVKSGELSEEHFQQIEHESFRVTGGRLAQIEDAYYLVGGHKFMGRYNPMGPDHGPGFEQEYTNEVRKFTLDFENEVELEVLTPIHDEMHLHRRDYNLTASFVDGKPELMLFSGVFQNTVDLPWLYPVRITADDYEPIEGFTQYFNHYHCATLPIYDETEEEMHTLFFGGIAQFYMDNDMLVQDNDVPFVNTIADVSQSKDGTLNERVLATQMPGYLGAGSEFILSAESEEFADDILSGAFIGEDFTEVGYIFGGIRSSLPNIFWINEGLESEASNTIYKVSLRKRKVSSTASVKHPSEKLFFYPNPAQSTVRMSLEMEGSNDIQIDIYNVDGEKLHSQRIDKSRVKSGQNMFVLDDVNVGYGAFLYNVSFGNKKIARKVIWAE